MDQSIEGPLRQIEAARLALHSPSLVGVRRPAPDPSMRGYAEMAAKPGRKCLSRTQMSEPYELSQDLLPMHLPHRPPKLFSNASQTCGRRCAARRSCMRMASELVE